MADEYLTAELDHIRAGIEIASDLPMTADPRRVVTIYAPRLLKALNAVLEHHQPRQLEQAESSTIVCITCTDGPDGDLWAEWPCPTVRDITNALLGEEKTNG